MSNELSKSSVSGKLNSSTANISGEIKNVVRMSLSGDIGNVGGFGTALWGKIKGDIENQRDLQEELHRLEVGVATQAEIEKILYLD